MNNKFYTVNQLYQVEWIEELNCYSGLIYCPECKRTGGWHKNHCQAKDSPDRRIVDLVYIDVIIN